MAIQPSLPDATFVPVAVIDNAYFPLIQDTVASSRSRERDPDTGDVSIARNDFLVTRASLTVAGVQTTVVHDTVYQDEVLHEDTLDFFAQDTDGNVWYFGEIVINYRFDDAGRFIGTDTVGAWSANDPGNAPGILMPGNPIVGPAYFEEAAPGIAEDEAIIIDNSGRLTTRFGSFTDVVHTINSSALAPDGIEQKFYAPGIGVVRDFDVANDGSRSAPSDLYRLGQVGAVDASDADDRVPLLRGLREGVAVADLGNVVDLDPADFAGAVQQVTYIAGQTDTVDALGAYFYDTGTGRISGARILIGDLSRAESGAAVTVAVPAGQTMALFLVANVDDLGIDLGAFASGGLQIVNILTGAAANIDDLIAPMVTNAAGDILPIQPLGALGANDGTNFLNPAGGVQAIGLDAATAPEGTVVIGFEDSLTTAPGHDGDYNDAIVAVSAAPLSGSAVAALAREARGVQFGGAGDDVLSGTLANEQFAGLGGDDSIDGGGGRDRINGGAGDDALDGESGSDVLIGGAGDDRLAGGQGGDSFIFRAPGFGADIIDDFRAAQGDRIVLGGVDFADLDSNGDGRLSAADAAIDRVGGALVIDFGDGDVLSLRGVGSLVADNFVFVA